MNGWVPPAGDDGLWSSDDVAAFLKLSKDQVLDLAERRELLPTSSRPIRFAPDAVVRWAASQGYRIQARDREAILQVTSLRPEDLPRSSLPHEDAMAEAKEPIVGEAPAEKADTIKPAAKTKVETAKPKTWRGGESLLTVEDVAQWLSVSPAWVYNHSFELPHYRIGARQLRFERLEVEKWLRGKRARI